MRKNSNDFSMQEAMRLAQSETGQQLIAALRAQNTDAVSQAMEQAAAGDMEKARQSMSSLLASPQIQALLEQLRRDSHG
jgi:hypothetical protein